MHLYTRIQHFGESVFVLSTTAVDFYKTRTKIWKYSPPDIDFNSTALSNPFNLDTFTVISVGDVVCERPIKEMLLLITVNYWSFQRAAVFSKDRSDALVRRSRKISFPFGVSFTVKQVFGRSRAGGVKFASTPVG